MTANDDSVQGPAAGKPGDSPPAAVTAVTEPDAATDDPSESTDAGAAEPDDLLGELSKAMHAATRSQHVRIAEALERQRVAQVEALKARTGSESDELTKASRVDIGEIDAWAKTATELIAAQRVRRIDARREKLHAEILRQGVIVEREVAAVEAAVEAHQAELHAFFSQLERESDPVEIARLAGSLPPLPLLIEVADAARHQAAAEFASSDEPAATATGEDSADEGAEASTARLMAVMDPEASKGSGIDVARPWAVPRAIGIPSGVGAVTVGANESNTRESPANDDSQPLLRAIPSTRPMDRLRSSSREPDDDPDREH